MAMAAFRSMHNEGIKVSMEEIVDVSG